MRFFLVLMLFFGSASAARVNANLTLTPENGGLNASLKFERAQSDQLLVWIWSAAQGGWQQRKAQPVEPILENGTTVYRFVTPIRSAGTWYMRTMIGAGQAGFIGFSQFYAAPTQQNTVFVSLENSLTDRVPGYVQPVGYAVYGLVGLFAFGLTALVFRRLERR
jgi:hypothetical protein